MKFNVFSFLFLISISACSQKTLERKLSTEDSIRYGEKVSIILGIHSEHKEPDSLVIKFLSKSNEVAFLHKGTLDGWGMRRIQDSIRTGGYSLIVTWLEGDSWKTTQRDIIIKSEAYEISLNVELANEPALNREHNAIYLDQYLPHNPDSVAIIRNWNPTEQFFNDSILLPDYTVTNHMDSTLYGAYLRFSSSLSINWVQPHYISFIRYENHKSTYGACNTPRVEMELKKGQTGETLKDMILGCPVENFKLDSSYVIRMDYMINDRIWESNPATGKSEDNVYVEQTIFSFRDKFTLEKN